MRFHMFLKIIFYGCCTNFNFTTTELRMQLLQTQPMGTFLLRPHEGDPELLYLSFRGTADEGVKHAIIRKEKQEGIAECAYKCGKIGPSSSVEELLT